MCWVRGIGQIEVEIGDLGGFGNLVNFGVSAIEERL